MSARPSPTNFYLNLLKIILFRPFGPAPVIFGTLTVLGAVISLFSPNLLGELNWLLWGVPLSFFLLFFLLGILWAPWILHQERNEGVSKEFEPPKVTVRTRMEEPVQVELERQATSVKEPPPLQKPVRTQEEVETKKVE